MLKIIKVFRSKQIIRWTFCLIFVMGVMTMDAHAFRYVNEDAGHDFILIGLGVFRQNFTNVDGEQDLFEDSEDGLPEEYSNRTRFALYGEGDIYSDYGFRLKGSYDEEDDDSEITAFGVIERGVNYLALGDHEEGLFQDTVFSAMDPKIRGVSLHGEAAGIGATFMAGGLRGESRVDEIRGDGTSGPYRLEEAPVIAGSETVRIEVRDRSNPSRVISGRTLSRGSDYSIDYDDGEITFADPVEEQDFRGNPVFIVVTYQFDSPGDTYKRAVWGGRLTYSPVESLQVGVTYLADGPWENEDVGNAADNRRQIYGADLKASFGERYQLGVEVARSEIPGETDDLSSEAIAVDVSANPVDPLHLYGGYWQVERDFLSFGNLNIESNTVEDEIDLDEPFHFKSQTIEFDLDPNISINHGTDEESFGLSAAYALTGYHGIGAGFRETRNNIPDDPDTARDTTRSWFASYKRVHPDFTDWLLGLEYMENTDDADPQTLDTETTRLVAAIKHPVGSFGRVGDVNAQIGYQYEDFKDNIADDNNAQTHDVMARVELLPIKEVTVYLEQAEQFVYEEVEDDFTRRNDITALGIEGRINRYFDLDASAQFRRENDLIAEEVTEDEQLYRLQWTSRPLDTLKTRVRIEYRVADDKVNDITDESSLVGGEVIWDALTNLAFTVKYDYELDETDPDDGALDRTFYDDFSFRTDFRLGTDFSIFGKYRLENEELETDGLDTTETTTTTWLAGAKYRFFTDWDILSSYKDKTIDGAIADHSRSYFAELGYQLNRYLKIALGYEYLDYTDEDTGDEYQANVGYVSFIGKL